MSVVAIDTDQVETADLRQALRALAAMIDKTVVAQTTYAASTLQDAVPCNRLIALQYSETVIPTALRNRDLAP